MDIQKVKLADIELKEVTAVTNNEADKSAVVDTRLFIKMLRRLQRWR